MGGGGGNMESGEPEFQIAPMIDVLLVLLIFFMSITTTQVAKVDKDIKLPVAADAKKKEDKNAMFEAALNVRWIAQKQESKIKLDNIDKSPEELIEILRQRKENNPTYRVIIRGDKLVPATEIQKVMTMIGQAGIDDISFSALNNDN
ncbi:MAG: biopolymer transporter ExbD [Verrucomicrobiales bacterium]|nr:biopolymer transporter ExbD [Verrucomicrobiales bacterium]MCP5558591.1 biopolymer transporter ExbD [Verrucomicrobiaceae bacterium]